MLQRIKDLLRLQDLSEHEIAVYVALLKLRKATMPQIREKCGLPNISVYRALRQLEDRDLVESHMMNGKQSAYCPLSLEKLIRKIGFAQRKLRRIELELRNLDSLLPYMEESEGDDQPEIDIRLGLDAFREEYLKVPETFDEEYFQFGNAAKFWESAKLDYDAPEERTFIRHRLASNLYLRALDIPSHVTERIQNNDSHEKRTMRLTSSLPVMNDLTMIGKKQITHFVNDKENPRVLIIRNPELVAAKRQQFETLWMQ